MADRHPDVDPDRGLGRLAFDWLAGVILIYSTLFGTGYVLLGWIGWGTACLTLAVGAAAFLWWDLRRQDRAVVFEAAEKARADS